MDRSYIALEFRAGEVGADALGDVDTDNITVVGHTIVGFIHPSKAPRINRGEDSSTGFGTARRWRIRGIGQ